MFEEIIYCGFREELYIIAREYNWNLQIHVPLAHLTQLCMLALLIVIRFFLSYNPESSISLRKKINYRNHKCILMLVYTSVN